eukprot:TRINITY_DN1269_c2_g3_i1.p1 TRINITY_DN1269_c2_g3~~TRINITY_DN1269_c2_g3_i1.p1  ORF type:complete len:733 (+),score=143.02 TRINITY_DN1269_c2_g3_i1:100-2298(+)
MKLGKGRKMRTSKLRLGLLLLVLWVTVGGVNWYHSLSFLSSKPPVKELIPSSDSTNTTDTSNTPSPTYDPDDDVGDITNPLTLSSPLYRRLKGGVESCFFIARYSCRSTYWGEVKGDISARLGDKESYQLTPVPNKNESFYLSKCNQEMFLVIGDAGIPQFAGIGKGTELTVFQNPFGVDDALMITISGDTGRSLGSVAGVYIRYVEHNDVATRLDALWHFVSITESVEYPNWVHILKGSTIKKANVTTNGPNCVRSFRGCCFLKRTVPDLLIDRSNNNNNNDNNNNKQQQIATLVVSSLVTLPRRLELLEKSLFNKPNIDVVITTDCHISFLQDRLEGHVAAWLIGPVAHFLKDFTEINLRVSLAVHWMFRKLRKDWYFIVDDDTLVFTENLKWLLRAFPEPGEKHYYIGHTSEWDEKTLYHGDMAFGGGGIVVSAAIRKVWNSQFRRENPSKEFVLSGHWSHSGGDGAVCRLTSLVMSRAGVQKYFTEVRGFHQLDILGNQGIEEVLTKDCPHCPSEFDQSGAWFDDVISKQPVFTLHHIGVIMSGSLFPNVSGPASIPILFSAYNALPSPLLFLRRHCTDITGFTVCVNFGRSIQLFQGIAHSEAMNVLLKESAVNGLDVPEKMRRMSLVDPVRLSLVGTVYWDQQNDNSSVQVYSASTTTERQTFVKAVTTFSPNDVNFVVLSVYFEDGTAATKKIDITHLTVPSEVSVNDQQFDLSSGAKRRSTLRK